MTSGHRVLALATISVLAVTATAPAATATDAGRAVAAERVATSTRIVPDPAGPRDEPSIYRNGCHAHRATVVARPCIFGLRSSTRVVVVFGDSHVAQWYGALSRAATLERVKMYWLTKTSCPAIDVTVRTWRGISTYPQCDVWRRSALARIRAIRPSLIITSSYDFHQIVRRGTHHTLSGAARVAEWRRGTLRTFRALSVAADRVVVLRDTPRQRVDVPLCVVAHGASSSRCRTPITWALRAGLWNVERAIARTLPDVSAVDLTRYLCGPAVCRPVTGRLLIWRDDTHLTDTYSRHLTPVLRPYVRLARPRA